MIRQLLAVAIFISACISSLSAETSAPLPSAKFKATWNVRDFGAKGDGQTKDTIAVQRALDACTSAGGGSVIVPLGNYLMGSVVIGSNTTLQLERGANISGSPDIADYPVVRVRWEGEFTKGHRSLISAEKADNVTITGPGVIIGPPLSVSGLRNPRGPALVELANGTNVVLNGFTTQYQQLWSVHLLYCRNVTASNLTIRSVLVNGDGIDVDSCRDVLIEHCNIDTGDDAIALKSGRGLEAVRIGRPTQNVVIKDCTLSSSIFAGLAIGSEMSGGIRDVRVENCRISGRQNGIFIKSREGRGGFIENIAGENLTINNSATFLTIRLLETGIQASEPVAGIVEKWARVHNISFSMVNVHNVGHLVDAQDIPPERPLDGLLLYGIYGDCGNGISLANMVNVKLDEIAVGSSVSGAFITTNNVKGVGLYNAAPLTSSR
jgi:polygalacturonase